MTPEAVAKWRITMAEIGLDGLTRQQRRAKTMVANNLAKDPDFYKKHAQIILASLGQEGIRRRGRTNSATQLGKNPGKGAAMRSYRNRVCYLSRKNDLSDLSNYEKWGKGYELDHRFSVRDGFELGVAAEILAHKANLQFLPTKQNRDKWYVSEFTLERLMEITA
jgi:hypothetical protein